MKVILAEYAGYCYGVERAFNMVEDAARRMKTPITTLGPLIHNDQAIKALEEEFGTTHADSLDDIQEGTVVIRTHGVAPEVNGTARRRNLEMIDATCPFVRKVQQLAGELVRDGYTLVILGEKNHPEVIGVTGHAGGKAIVVEEPEEILSFLPLAKAGIVVQTTQQFSKLDKLVSLMLSRCKELVVHNTICYATSDRQDAARTLARTVEAMVVVGGRHSGNTRRLVEVCEQERVPVFHVETAQELDERDYAGKESVGVTAGASTPDFVIRDVIHTLERF
jgi:(E)-4-hydroxy-3-methyl-but-2-enyl pyrophosphate reductase